VVQLFAYNLIGEPDELLIWVGILGVATPPVVDFEVAGQVVVAQLLVPGFEPLGDDVTDVRGKLLNHRAIFKLHWPATSERFKIVVRIGVVSVALTSKRPPLSLPAKNSSSYNLLLSSCYYQPNDKSQALAGIIQTIKPIPDFTLLAGDQVYLDLPSQQNLPKDKRQLAQTLGKKYQYNWFSAALNQPGLADVLRHGPVFCVPDDHEFWNNFPLAQAQLNNTYHASDRQNWCELATRLYQRYQMSPAQAEGFFRQDIAPLSMLFLDGRTQRDADGERMFNAATHAAIEGWTQDLLARKQNNEPAIGLLSSGQALIIETPGRWARKLADMEMPNYKDFSVVIAALERLFEAGIPVLYVTGDVHWGRIVEGKNQRGDVLFYEVIASPSRLIDTSGADQMNTLKNNMRKLFGEGSDFPVHPQPPEDVNAIKFCRLQLSVQHRQQGDHVALLRFHAIPGGIEFHVDYVCTDANEKKRRAHSVTRGPYKLIGI
jgi:hypothetical protein